MERKETKEAITNIPTISLWTKENQEPKTEMSAEENPSSSLDENDRLLVENWFEISTNSTNFHPILLSNQHTQKQFEKFKKEIFKSNSEIERQSLSYNQARKHLPEFFPKISETLLSNENTRTFATEHKRFIKLFGSVTKTLDVNLYLMHLTPWTFFFSTFYILDYMIQNACFAFAFHSLWMCEKNILNCEDICKLLTLAIEQIEGLNKIRTRRLYFWVSLLDQSKVEWFAVNPYHHLYFRKDLTRCQHVDQVKRHHSCDFQVLFLHTSFSFIKGM